MAPLREAISNIIPGSKWIIQADIGGRWKTRVCVMVQPLRFNIAGTAGARIVVKSTA